MKSQIAEVLVIEEKEVNPGTEREHGTGIGRDTVLPARDMSAVSETEASEANVVNVVKDTEVKEATDTSAAMKIVSAVTAIDGTETEEETEEETVRAEVAIATEIVTMNGTRETVGIVTTAAVVAAIEDQEGMTGIVIAAMVADARARVEAHPVICPPCWMSRTSCPSTSVSVN